MTTNFNKKVAEHLKDMVLDIPAKGYTPKYASEKEYHKSFDDIKSYSKSVKASVKKSINCVIFNRSNADGIISAYIVLRYLKEKLKANYNSENILLLPTGASSGSRVSDELKRKENKISGKSVIFLDLGSDNATLNYLKKISKSLIVIDDHPIFKNSVSKSNLNDKNFFIGDDTHSACAYTWKFFYPTKKVNRIVQMIDADDRKIAMKHLGYTRPLQSFFNFRYAHNPQKNLSNHRTFDDIDDFINNTNNNLVTLVGHYYDELENNMKDQIAKNAAFGYFEGHPVYILNYNDPVLYKKVLRQMVTNAKNDNKKIDFAVTWGWEHRNNMYSVQLSEEHYVGPPKHNLPEISKKLGKIGKTGKGGGGSKYIGHFYWPRNKDKDIWDLFGKKAKYL